MGLTKVGRTKYISGIRVLMYHSIDFGTSRIHDLYSLKWPVFADHLKLIQKEGFEFKKMSDDWQMDKKTVVVTFDDGYADNFEVANKLAKDHIPLTIFIVSDFIGLKNYLTTAQVKELASMPHVEIGCHGKTHRPLTTLKREEWMEEIKLSKSELEYVSGRAVTSMSFPHGKYTEEMVYYAHGLGFKRIATSDSGINRDTDLVKIKRTAIFKYDYNWIMAQKLLGLWDHLSPGSSEKVTA
ncbi:MAG: polysaccharide deacetylase family protein [Bacteriovorax sp.]|jgi:peptidoglycan/xylan/chitin deacetylase (PgdA/CDA1 family)